MATAVNNKCLRKVEIRRFFTGGNLFALHTWSEREKIQGVRERENLVKHYAAQAAGVENVNSESLHKR